MGSPPALVLANLFLGHHERLWLNKYQGPLIHFYRRYVNGTFCPFNNEHETILFFQYLNSQHDNVRFTMEKEANRTLAFHDVCISKIDPSCRITSVYHKKIFTGQSTIFSASLLFLTNLALTVHY